MKRYLPPIAGALLLVLALTTYVTLKVAGDLRAARSILLSDGNDIEPAQVKEAEARLESAQRTLGSVPARMLRVVPIVGQNLTAVSDIVDASLPVLAAGSDLSEALEPLRDGGLIQEGRIDASKIAALAEPAGKQVESLSALLERARDARSGWLMPPLWGAIDELMERSASLLDGATSLERFVAVSDDMIGHSAPRIYLVLLLNNAELRGAGGILAGVGTIRLNDGKIRIGRFRSVHELQTHPYEEVPAPEDYARRYSTYKANTTLWLNTSFSPDVPDVGLVAARLYELTTGVATDGAVVLDPRGIASLLPPEAQVEIPGRVGSLSADEVAPFIYSDAYSLYRNQVARRNAILALGKSAFAAALGADFGGTKGLDRIGSAVAGGHIRLASFAAPEEEVLRQAGVAGELDAGEEAFPLRVVAQNFGSDNGEGTKLDYWVDRQIDTACDLAAEGGDPEMSCLVTTTLANEVPPGLGEYVGGEPYGVLKSLLETYVPQGAEITSVTLDGRPAEAFVEDEGTSTSVGVFATVPAGEVRSVAVSFEGAVSRDGLTLSFTPQPLARDAELDLSVSVPAGWRAVGFSDDVGGDIESSGALDQPLEIRLEPDPHAGFGAIWRSFTRFWHEPLF